MTEVVNFELPSNNEILRKFLADGSFDGGEYLQLKDALKPIFFGGSFMEWRWGAVRERTKLDVAYKGEALLAGIPRSMDNLVIEFSSYANILYQGRQANMMFECDKHFPDWPQDGLDSEQVGLANQIAKVLRESGRARDRAIMLISSRAETSGAQSRKSIAGKVAEQTVELVLRATGFIAEKDFKNQFGSKGSDTDFVVPCVDKHKDEDVKAYIAVQSSTNDRARLSTSELKPGARGFLVSLNGCPASSKDSTDIGSELLAGYKSSKNFYVVIQQEKDKAIADAKKRIRRGNKKDMQDREIIEERLAFFARNAINFDEFSEKLKDLHQPI